jgi:DnaJ-class molecular chaperone
VPLLFSTSTVTRPGYGKPNAQEVFERFFGTANPFADFGYNDAMPFGSKLKKPGPKKADPVVQELPLTLEELFNGCTKRLAITRKVHTIIAASCGD